MYRCFLFVAMVICAGCRPAEVPSDPPSAPKSDEEQFVPPTPKVYKPIDQATIEAWQKQGFQAGWISEDNGVFAGRPEGLKNAVPGFAFMNAHPNPFDLKALPAVEVPFGLSVSDNSLDPKQVRVLLGAKNLTVFTIWAQRLNTVDATDTLLKDLTTAPRLTAVHLWSYQSQGQTSPIQVGRAGLSELAKLKHLASLSLSGSTIGDTDVRELRGLENLTTLHLDQTKLTDSGAKEIAKLSSLNSLDLTGTTITDASLRELVALKRLTSLTLPYTKITANGMKELTALKNLTSLSVGGTDAARGEGLKALSALERLDTLDLSSSQLKPVDLRELTGLKRLTTLRLLSTGLTDQDLKELAPLTTLTSLNLANNPQITGAGIAELAPLKNLTTLEVGAYGTLTDKDLKAFARLKSLKSLAIDPTAITDAGLKELALLTNLTSLELKGFSRTTKTGVEELRKSLPGCRIIGPW
ncbi:MAG: hypothetical protein L0241_20570 [Planctomycetia bacterium]|nr:hypothetical protein [Planctomycetia bacterium]